MPDKPYDNFVDNKLTDEKGYPSRGPQPVDFRYDIMNYGRVDQTQNAVLLRNKTLAHAGLPNVSTIKELKGPDVVYALNFVADAFKALKLVFKKANTMSRLDNTGMRQIKVLEPVRGYEDPQKEYNNYTKIVSEIFQDAFLASRGRNKKVLSFADFMKMFRAFHDDYGQELVFTKSGFIKSPIFNPLSSGLAIELDKLDPSDNDNATKWITDPNFEFYRTTAIRFGFKVDKYMPWRLVADVSSTQMQDYWIKEIYPSAQQIAKHRPKKPDRTLDTLHADYKTDQQIMEQYYKREEKYGLIQNPRGASNLFDAYYEKTYLTDAYELRKILFDMYVRFVENSPTVMKFDNISCKHTKLSKTFIPRETITFAQVKKEYPMEYWMELCFRMRLKEENLKIEQNEYNKFVKNGKKMMKMLDIVSSMEYINNVVKMLKSKSADVRFCQDYEKCIGENLPIQMMPRDRYLKNILTKILAGLIPPPNFDAAYAAMEQTMKDLEAASQNAKASTGAQAVDLYANMHGFDD